MSTAAAGSPGWGRRRLLAVAAAAALLAASVLAFLVSAAAQSLTRPAPGASSGIGVSAPTSGALWRDRVAAAPMLRVDPAASRPGVPDIGPSRFIEVPPAAREGPVGVPTGYPRTPAGAVGQLAAIDTTVLTGMALEHMQAVHQAWSLPGAPPVQAWVMAANVAAFLAAAGPSPAGSPPAVVAASPVGGQVKGVDGPDWVLACVLLRVDATIADSASIAYGHCERLQWSAGRWQIAPGAQPAPAPSTWPGTQLAARAGWLTWAPGEQG
jgi:hypothetical protein